MTNIDGKTLFLVFPFFRRNIIRKLQYPLLFAALIFSSCASRSEGITVKENQSEEIKAAPVKTDIDLEYDPNRLVFLLIGQSNMEGAATPDSEEDVAINERVFVLAYTDDKGRKREYNKWYYAKPPLHAPWKVAVGPGDYFGKIMASSLPDEYSIALVPCAISGVDIDFFRKDIVSKRRNEFSIPPDNKREGAYEMVLERALLASKAGKISGILFHQGESDSGQMVWLDKVKEMVNDLRTDLDIPDLPFLAGELYYKGACSGHNSIIRKLPERIDNSYVISADGLTGIDSYHFDIESQRELGRRYAEKMLEIINIE